MGSDVGTCLKGSPVESAMQQEYWGLNGLLRFSSPEARCIVVLALPMTPAYKAFRVHKVEISIAAGELRGKLMFSKSVLKGT